MSDTDASATGRTPEAEIHPAERLDATRAARPWAIARAVAWDVMVAVIVVALIATTLLFASHVSSFIYVGF